MGEFWVFSWVWVALAGILLGGFTEWLKFKSKQQQLGTSAKELEQTVSSLKAALTASEERQRALVERVQNLETIVTSQAWDTVNGSALPAPEEERLFTEPHARLRLPEEEADSVKAERLARRLRV